MRQSRCATISLPVSANHKNKNGAVIINPVQCFGGAVQGRLPVEIPQRQSGVGIYLHVLPDFMSGNVMYKCDLCSDRLKEGKNRDASKPARAGPC